MLDYREQSQGSFEAWGAGFRYNYNNKKQALDIFHHRTERVLARFRFDEMLSAAPLPFVVLIEKTSQVSALMFSNNQTVNLADTMELKRLRPILKSVSTLSRHAFDLQHLNLDRFCFQFAEQHNLKSVKIKKFVPRDESNAFFIARLLTHHDNGICVRACTLTGVMAAMSDKTLRDLMTMEFGYRFEGSAHNLLNVSSRLSSLSFILDENFVPQNKIMTKSTHENDFINMH